MRTAKAAYRQRVMRIGFPARNTDERLRVFRFAQDDKWPGIALF